MQPAECSRVSATHWICLGQRKPAYILVTLCALMVLTACSTTANQPRFEANPQTLSSIGGYVNLSWNIEDAEYYSLQSDPPIPGMPLFTKQSHTTIRIEGRQNSNPINYQLILEARGSRGIRRFSTFIRVNGRLDCSSKTGLRAQSTAIWPEVKKVGLGNFDVPYVKGRLIAYHKNELSLQSNRATAQSLGAQWARDLGKGWSLYYTRPGQEAAVAQRLYQNGIGQYVQPEYLYQPDDLSLPPNNRSYDLEQAALFRQMDFELAWKQLRVDCLKPVIAVVDSGIYTQRIDLAPNLTPQESWLDVVGSNLEDPRPNQGAVEPFSGTGASHGTQVASIIAATTNDGSVLAGAAYNLLRVLPIKVFDAQRRAGTLQLAQALEYAAGATQIAGRVYTNPTPAQVVNLSLSISIPGFQDPYLEQVLEQVTRQGLIVVASSGNLDSASVGYPASSPFVIAVGAVDSNNKRAKWLSGFASNYGSGLEFVAPGTGVPVAHGPNTGDYALAYGTSAAAPFVSTAVGLYLLKQQQMGFSLSSDPGSFLKQVRKCLLSAAKNSAQWDIETGFGLISVARVVDPNNPGCFPQENP
ncbi:S8/S53 family peptidase [Meiothermus sp. CFH 77666]|uniref:S8 family serine peptidase n=1 Tax=Meiothermus sp. CFH 77666 TaxID=2817942 RepID=UPI001AA04494|nr:S8/S53 family peptidase [Meiothermus sp. CFH 77666]